MKWVFTKKMKWILNTNLFIFWNTKYTWWKQIIFKRLVSSWRKDANLRILRVYESPFLEFYLHQHVFSCPLTFCCCCCFIVFNWTKTAWTNWPDLSKMGLSWAILMSIISIYITRYRSGTLKSFKRTNRFPYSVIQPINGLSFELFRFCCCLISLFTLNISP